MLKDQGSNASAKRLNKEMKEKEVKYGEVCGQGHDALGLVGEAGD